MRSFGSRDDTFVCDEPFYAHYLRETGAPHPGREEVMARGETDWRKVASWLTGETREGKTVFFQKHMAHHLLPGMERSWLGELHNAFLIRDPREMLTSLVRVTPDPSLQDTGLPQQWTLFRELCTETGRVPPVIDSRDVLGNPRRLLNLLCSALEVPFSEAMLRWKTGPRATDGVWAKYWYASVEESTGFAPYRPKPDPVPVRLKTVHAQCMEYYERLSGHRLGP
jgi:hypothetical protein